MTERDRIEPFVAPLSMPAPIFLVGCMGSGSTLTRLMLDSHEHIAIPQETSFMRLVQAHRWVPFWRYGDRLGRRLKLSRPEMNEYLRSFYGGMFERYARLHGKQRWGEKTPHHIWHMPEMARLFKDSVFVGIVRHPGGTSSSLVGRFNYESRRSVNYWVKLNTQLTHHGTKLGDRFALIRYEDVVSHPEETMRELLEWLGEPWSPSVLRHHEVQTQQGAPRTVEGRTKPADPLDPSRMARWTTQFTDVELTFLRRKTKGLASFFGYSVDEPIPVETLAPATGPELAARRSSYEGQVDFSPAERPRKEDLLRPELLDVPERAQNSPAAAAPASFARRLRRRLAHKLSA
jgi:hypothetical protein